ncbi:MAG: hypothetical protein WCA27_10225 [Candidatus Sulfotelmatobacter sp.]
MILLITSSASGPQCADALGAATGLETHWAHTLQEAATRLREQTYSADSCSKPNPPKVIR